MRKFHIFLSIVIVIYIGTICALCYASDILISSNTKLLLAINTGFDIEIYDRECDKIIKEIEVLRGKKQRM